MSQRRLRQFLKWPTPPSVIHLERFFLDCPGVTDASVPVLAGMTQLEVIELVDDRLRDEGFESLQPALPNCMMTRLKSDEIDTGNSG
jgi:hypothetical protein